MAWFIFAFLAAFANATYFALVKKYIARFPPYAFMGTTLLIGSFLLFLFSAWQGIPSPGPQFYPAFILTTLLNIGIIYFYVQALRLTDLSHAFPMLSFTPVFLVFTSFFMLGEFPTALGLVGILLIVLGSYLLNRDAHDGLLTPFRRIFKEKAIFFMLVMAFLVSLAANFDKIVIQNSSITFGFSIELFMLGIFYLALSFRSRPSVTHSKVGSVKLLAPAFLTGIFVALDIGLIGAALASQIVPYVMALKRLAILFAVVYGGVFLREKHLVRRAMAALLMVGGVALILLS